MSAPLYALVAYVKSPVGIFVEDLRRELHPEHAEQPAHVTVLPPRPLQGAAEDAQRQIEEVCRTIQPFELALGEVATFTPVTPTVFIRVARAAYRMRELHDKLNAGALAYDEPWPYMPHLTIVKVAEPEAAHRASVVSRQRWAQYRGVRRIWVEELTFVCAGESDTWIDVAAIRLGDQRG